MAIDLLELNSAQMLHGIAKEGTNFINIDKRDKVETHALEQLSRIYRSL